MSINYLALNSKNRIESETQKGRGAAKDQLCTVLINSRVSQFISAWSSNI